MKFGIMLPYMQGPVEDGAYASAFARLVEELGFESIWAVDHVVMCPDYRSRYPYAANGRSPFHADVVQPDPLVWLTWAAAVTQKIRLATGILILPLRNPVVLAKTVASLDRLSGGRLLLGVGVGWVREEAEAVGSSFPARGERTDEYIQAMRALWRSPVSSFQGETVGFEQVVSRPRPMREDGVPIVVGGHSPAAARRAGSLGDGFYPLGVTAERLGELLEIMRRSAREVGRDPDAIEVTTAAAPELAHCRRLAEAGADRLAISPGTGDLAELRPVLERFREEVMEPLSGVGRG